MLNSLTAGTAPEIATSDFRQPPHNIEIEQALLGAILINNEAWHRIADLVSGEHFHEPLHEAIFEAIGETIEDGKIANPVTLKNRFDGFDAVGGLPVPSYLGLLASQATSVINAPEYARALVDLSARRRLIVIGEDIVNDAYDLSASVPPKSLVEDAEKRLYEIAEKSRSARDEIMFADAARSAMNAANKAHMTKGRMCGLSTGIKDLDDKLGGLQPTDLIIIAGRPSMGKTALAMNIAWSVARGDYVDENGEALPCPVDFRSLEMSGEQLAMRVLSMVSGVPSEKLRRGTCSEAEIERAMRAGDEISSTPMIIDESGGLTIAQLSARARRTKRKHGTRLIVVDYLQLLQGSGKRRDGSRVQEVTEITVGLKALAKELQVPIIALSQLSRATENRESKRPQLSDLRESGSIEQDADVVMFVYREEYYIERREPDPGEAEKHAQWQAELQRAAGRAEAIIGKQRHGPTGIVPLAFEAELTRFSGLARERAQ